MASSALSVDGLFCALVVAPQVYARNRFNDLSSSPRCERLGAEPSSCEALSDSWSALRAGGAK